MGLKLNVFSKLGLDLIQIEYSMGFERPKKRVSFGFSKEIF